MRTTLDLDEELIEGLMKVSGAKTKTAAIHLAISEFIRRKRIAKLLSLRGKIRIEENWRELEELELEEARHHHR